VCLYRIQALLKEDIVKYVQELPNYWVLFDATLQVFFDILALNLALCLLK
jgi:hypothetical protein